MMGWLGAKDGSRRYEKAKDFFGELKEFESFEELLKGPSPEDVKAVLLSEQEYSKSMSHLSFVTEELIFGDFCDGFLKRGGGWVPQISYLQVFQNQLSSSADYVDTSKGVLVVGDFEPSRAALIALFKIGFRDFFLLGERAESGFTDSMKRHMFGVNVKRIEISDLVNLSGVASVLLHGISEKDAVIGEWELSYLNFLGRPGLLIDFLPDGFLSQVIKETQDEGLFLLEREEIEKLSLEWWKSKQS